MYLILREVNSTLPKQIGLAEYSLSRQDTKVYPEYNLSGTGDGGTQM